MNLELLLSSQEKAYVLKFECNSSQVTRINGENFDSKRSSPYKSVLSLFIGSMRLEQFPRGIGLLFPSLETLDVNNNCIDKITSEDFEDLSQLTSLNLSKNYLVELPGDLFNNCPFLSNLDMSGNFIRFIDTKLFDRLLCLDTIDFSNNTDINISCDLSKSPKHRGMIIAQITEKCKRSTEKVAISNLENHESDKIGKIWYIDSYFEESPSQIKIPEIPLVLVIGVVILLLFAILVC